MLRLRESRDLRLISSQVEVTPAGALTWAQDVFGNDVATVTFSAMTDVLAIDATAELELHASAWPVFDISLSIFGRMEAAICGVADGRHG